MATTSAGPTPVPPATIPAPSPAEPVVWSWPPTPKAVPLARRALRETLAAWGMAALADDAELVLAELLGNAVEHARGESGPVEARCSLLPRATGVRVEVWDGDAFRVPVLGAGVEDAARGRGLQLVDALTQRMWGVASREDVPGKVVWAHVGGEAEHSAPYCDAVALLGARLAARVLAFGEDVACDLVARRLLCALERGHDDDHVGLVYDHLHGPDAGAVWAPWKGETRPREVGVRADCTGKGCALFAAHPGRHTWEWGA
ncbi:ATP-binding protein [Streptomyces sp. NPDC021020]|uniref:ATP-binding protein n=1 Tax=Streptomyces sp. NPDC021020 TaxID=3365109 RepID=UPI003797E936